ncbi:MAG: hypothetical protein ACI9CO_000882 [Candidatus Azotimanducaceae bacterium]|jgi:hypothetical protein
MTFNPQLQAFIRCIPKQITLTLDLLWSVFNLSVSVHVTVNAYNDLHYLITAT